MAAGIVIFVFLLVAEFCAGQNQDGCAAITVSCDACLSFSGDCFWCSLPPDVTGVRCRNRTMSNADMCPPLLLEKPESRFEITQNDTLGNATQIAPQSLRLELRRGIRKTFQVDVQPSPFAPFDLYLLMDLSQSLATDLNTIRNLTSDIADNLTLNSPSFGMGFGSFVDKTTLPYALPTYMYIQQSNNESICVIGSDVCGDTYSFRHVLSPTNEVQQFADMLANVSVSVSTDNPEGGLDAMLQTAVCPEVIGWRDVSVLRLLMYITDAGYHVAGDGVLGGIVRPNDGRCHMELVNGIYENVAATVFDYPSIYQLNQLLAQENIIPIFAVDTSRVDEYQQLVEGLGSTGAQVRSRERGSANIVNVIQQSYNEARETVRVIPGQVPTGLTVSVTPLCNRITEDNGCAGVQLNEKVSFEVSVTLEDCELVNTPVDVTFSVPGFGTTVLTVIPVCTCECSREENHEPNSDLCTNGNGTVVCGTCACNSGRSGRLCQCNPDQRLQECPPAGQMQKCLGRGTCNECNECECDIEPGTNQRYFGDACECSRSTCPFNTEPTSEFFNLTCSGDTRGECDCGTTGCTCRRAPLSNERYFSVPGQPCGCDPDNCYNQNIMGRSGLCINPDGGMDGTCTCSGCECPENYTLFNKTCRRQQIVCDIYTDCANCSRRQGATSTSCGCESTILNRNSNPPSAYVVRCRFLDGNNCVNVFHVSPDSSQPILIEEEITCPTNNLGWIIAVSLVGGILLLGLLALIIIKIILVLVERVEYKKFTQQLQEAEWAPHENPLYVNPQQNYRNVLYKRRH